MVHSFTNKLGTRATRRHHPRIAEDEEGLTRAIVRLAERFGRYGCRRITAMLHREGWQVNHKRVERIWRKEGLKVPRKQPQFIIEQWRKEYNQIRPHSSLGYRSPAPETVVPWRVPGGAPDPSGLTYEGVR